MSLNTESVRFSFGDSPEMANHLLDLVIRGLKTATCGAARDFTDGGEVPPKVGRRDIVLDGEGRPAAVIETLEVTRKRFSEIDEQFARDEGEGMLTVKDWRDGHRAYFERNGGYSPDMELICERFKLVEVLEGDKKNMGTD